MNSSSRRRRREGADFDALSFEIFIRSLRLRHFSHDEVVQDHWPRPPRELWGNIVLTLLVADRVRQETGQPWRISNAYRDEQYNAAVGGSKLSNHRQFTSLDMQTVMTSTAAFYEEVGDMIKGWHGELFDCPVRFERVPLGDGTPFKVLPTWDLRGGAASKVEFLGGVGIYDNFLHVDSRGEIASWYG